MCEVPVVSNLDTVERPQFKKLMEEDDLREKARMMIEEAKMEQLTNQTFKTVKLNRLSSEQEERQKQLREKARRLIEDARRGRIESLSDLPDAKELLNESSNNASETDSTSVHEDQLSIASLESETSAGEGIVSFKQYKVRKVRDLPSLRQKLDLRTNDTWKVSEIYDNIISNEERRRSRQNNGKRSPIKSHYVDFELQDLEREQEQITKQATVLEKRLRQIMGKEENRTTEEFYLKKWLELVNKRNALIRRQMQLNILENEKNLNTRYSLLNEELQTLVTIEESQKTEIQKKKEKLLLEELVEIVNKRSELVLHMDTQEKAIEDDDEAERLAQGPVINSPLDADVEKNCILM